MCILHFQHIAVRRAKCKGPITTVACGFPIGRQRQQLANLGSRVKSSPLSLFEWLGAEMEFYIFKWLRKNTRRRIFADTWKWYEIQISKSCVKAYWSTAGFIPWQTFCGKVHAKNDSVDPFWEAICPPKFTLLPSGPLQSVPTSAFEGWRGQGQVTHWAPLHAARGWHVQATP